MVYLYLDIGLSCPLAIVPIWFETRRHVMYELMNPVTLFAGVFFLMLIAAAIGIFMEYRFEIVKMMREYYEGKSFREILEEGPQAFLSVMFSAVFTFVTVLNMFWQSWKAQLAVVIVLLFVAYYIIHDVTYEVLFVLPILLILARTSWLFKYTDPAKFEPSPRFKPTPLPTISKTPYVEKKAQKKLRPSAGYHLAKRKHR